MSMDAQNLPDSAAVLPMEDFKQPPSTNSNSVVSNQSKQIESAASPTTCEHAVHMRRTDGVTMAKVCSFIIHRGITAIAGGYVKFINRHRNGSLKIVPNSHEQIDALLAAKTLGPYPVVAYLSSYCIKDKDGVMIRNLIRMRTNKCPICRMTFEVLSDPSPTIEPSSQDSSAAVKSEDSPSPDAAEDLASTTIEQSLSSIAIEDPPSTVVIQDSPSLSGGRDSPFIVPEGYYAWLASREVDPQECESSADTQDSTTSDTLDFIASDTQNSSTSDIPEDSPPPVVAVDSASTTSIAMEDSPSTFDKQDSPSPDGGRDSPLAVFTQSYSASAASRKATLINDPQEHDLQDSRTADIPKDSPSPVATIDSTSKLQQSLLSNALKYVLSTYDRQDSPSPDGEQDSPSPDGGQDSPSPARLRDSPLDFFVRSYFASAASREPATESADIPQDSPSPVATIDSTSKLQQSLLSNALKHVLSTFDRQDSPSHDGGQISPSPARERDSPLDYFFRSYFVSAASREPSTEPDTQDSRTADISEDSPSPVATIDSASMLQQSLSCNVIEDPPSTFDQQDSPSPAGGRVSPMTLFVKSYCAWSAAQKVTLTSDLQENEPSPTVAHDSSAVVPQDVSPSVISVGPLSKPKIPSLLSLNIPCPYPHKNPWWNAECESSRKEQKKSLHSFQKCPTHDNFVAFKQAKAKARSVRRQSKRRFCEASANPTA